MKHCKFFGHMIAIVLVWFVLISWCALPVRALLEDEQNTITVVKQNTNTVVFITNIKLVRDFYYSEEQVARGTGSGFIWNNQGYIVTNYHVIEDGDLFSVTLPNQKSYSARLVGKEATKDIAVLQIENSPQNLTPIKPGISSELQVGQKVIAIGNPFGFDHSVTTGIISALGRQIMGVGGVTIRDMIQTDASINPGNSGGPLLNSDGQLIGMNTMIVSKSGSSSGVGFAVPVDTIKRIVPQLIKYGKVIRPSLNINLLPDRYAQRINVKGVVILEVPAGSAESHNGIRGVSRDRFGRFYLGDIIVGIDNIKITSYDELYNTLEKYKIGDWVTLSLVRDEKARKTKVKLVSAN